jgi:hypothetical protein
MKSEKMSATKKKRIQKKRSQLVCIPVQSNKTFDLPYQQHLPYVWAIFQAILFLERVAKLAKVFVL